MKNREKLIVAMTIVAAIYGALDFMSGKRPPPPASVVAAAPDLEATLATQLASLTESKKIDHGYLADQISAAWPPDIFLRHKPQKIAASVEIDDTAIDFQFDPQEFSYSGYLQMADEKIAIINGLDYREGETINQYHLKTISSEMIQLARDGLTFNIPARNEQR